MIETRIEVNKSDVKTVYIPQYKSKFFWWSIWIDFTHDSCGSAFKAYVSATKREDSYSKEWAEFVCEEYHRIENKKIQNKEKEKLHNKTKKISYYKHP